MAPLMVRVSLAVWLIVTLDFDRCGAVKNDLKSFFTDTIKCPIEDYIGAGETEPLALYLQKCGFEDRFVTEVKNFVSCKTLYDCLKEVSAEQNVLEGVVFAIHDIPREDHDCKTLLPKPWAHAILESVNYIHAQEVLQGYLRFYLNECGYEQRLATAITEQRSEGYTVSNKLSSLGDYLITCFWPIGSMTKIYKSEWEIISALGNAVALTTWLTHEKADCTEWYLLNLLSSTRKCTFPALREFAKDHLELWLEKCGGEFINDFIHHLSSSDDYLAKGVLTSINHRLANGDLSSIDDLSALKSEIVARLTEEKRWAKTVKDRRAQLDAQQLGAAQR